MNETDETFHEKPRSGSLAQNKVLTKYAPNSVFDFYTTTPNKEDTKKNMTRQSNNTNST